MAVAKTELILIVGCWVAAVIGVLVGYVVGVDPLAFSLPASMWWGWLVSKKDW